MVLTLYNLIGSPPSRSTLMLLDILDLEAERITINTLYGEQLTEEFRKKNPVHTVPTLDDDGFIIFESNAIAAYLVDKYAKDDSLYPKDLQKRAIVNQRLLFNAAIVFPAFRAATSDVLVKGLGKVTDESRDGVFNTYALVEAQIASTGGPWFTGDQLTIADIFTVTTISSLDSVIPIDATKYPKTDAWLKKCSEWPSFQKINVEGNEVYKNLMKSKLQ